MKINKNPIRKVQTNIRKENKLIEKNLNASIKTPLHPRGCKNQERISKAHEEQIKSLWISQCWIRVTKFSSNVHQDIINRYFIIGKKWHYILA